MQMVGYSFWCPLVENVIVLYRAEAIMHVVLLGVVDCGEHVLGPVFLNTVFGYGTLFT